MSKVIEFKEGDVVKCIDSTDIGFYAGLTMGKYYTIIKSYISSFSGSFVTIIDDCGDHVDFFTSRFVIDKTPIRNETIDEILK